MVLSLSLAALQFQLGLAVGLLLGLALLIREILLAFPILVAGMVMLRRRSWHAVWLYFLALSVGMGLMVGPWIARNVLSTGHLVLITDRAEYAGSKALGSDYVPPRFKGRADTRRVRSAVDAARYALHSDMLDYQAFLSAPSHYLWTVAMRLEFTWLHPNGLESLPPGIIRWGYRLGHALILLLALIGAGEALWQRRWRAWPLVSVLGYTVLIHLFLTTSVPRYSIPILSVILLLAVAGTLWLWRRVRSQLFAEAQS